MTDSVRFTQSPDGQPVAFECHGRGPGLVLLHGGGGSHGEWAEAGYVARLAETFTVLTPDLRGHGQSGQPTDPGAYTPEKLGQDILAAADACFLARFHLWGMSYGGKVGRYLAVRSARVASFIQIGTPMGPGVSGQRRREALDFVAHWPPILRVKRDGTLDPASLSEHDQALLDQFDVAVMLAWVRAMLDWPAVEPADFTCPTLWLVGTEDPHAMATVRQYRDALPGSPVALHLQEGLDHMQVFEEVDRVLPTMLAFTVR